MLINFGEIQESTVKIFSDSRRIYVEGEWESRMPMLDDR